MADFMYTIAKQMLGRAELDMHTNGARFDIILCSSNTDADTTAGATTVAALALDEFDGANYVRKTPNQANYDFTLTATRAEWDNTDNVVWTALGPGTRALAGALIVQYVDGAGADIPILWIESGGIATFNGNTGDFTIQWNTNGIAQIT
ncbi:MAG: hypothetical protein ACYSUI_19855 [Planctomycetota bacterium]|jgi:hypothetical protein